MSTNYATYHVRAYSISSIELIADNGEKRIGFFHREVSDRFNAAPSIVAEIPLFRNDKTYSYDDIIYNVQLTNQTATLKNLEYLRGR